MSDQAALMNWVHRQNIERYLRMMKTPLTSVERSFLEQRIAEEETSLRQTIRAEAPAKTAAISEARRM
jgi:hypothetical protein